MRLFILGLSLLCSTAFAEWQLDQERSSINFISTKNVHISEMHSFEQLQGRLSDDGALSVVVDLASVNTLIEIRDTRMREMLFKVGEFANATFSAQIPNEIMNMPVGSVTQTEVSGQLDLHGTKGNLGLSLSVARVNASTFTATTTKPVIINASQFGLASGIEALQAIAGLNAIGLAVPVTFSVTFTR